MRKHRKLLRIAVVVAIFLLLGVTAAVWALDKMKGDPEIIDDIDRHFSKVSAAQTADQTPHVENTQKEMDTAARSVAPVKQKTSRTKSGQRRSRPRKPPRAAQSPQQPPWPGISKIAPATYTISPALAASARSNPKPFIQGARAVLTAQNGTPVGFRLVRIFPGTALFAAGLRNGDILTAVNGNKLSSIDDALLAAGTLKMADRFRVDLLRGGRPVSLYYQVK